jgi:glutathione S-transferase
VLITDEGVLLDSFDIARYAEAHGNGTPLFPAQHGAAIADWNARSEAALASGRKAAFRRALNDPETLEEGLEPLLPAPLRRPMRFMAKGAVAYMRRKYDIEQVDDSVMVESLDALRAALRQHSHVLGALTYADLAMAVVLQFVRPVSGDYVPLGPATRRTFGDPALASRYPDLLAWRDNLYAQHRRQSADQNRVPENRAAASGEQC